MDHSDPELIDTQVVAARAGLAERLGALEQRVVGAVDCATESVRETADAVRGTVSGIADDVRGFYHSAGEAARTALDIRRQVREHPWPAVGIAGLLGFVAGLRLQPRPQAPSPVYSAESTPPRRSSPLVGGLWDRVQRELMDIGEKAIVVASNTVKENLETIAHTASQQIASKWGSGNGQHNGANGW